MNQIWRTILLAVVSLQQKYITIENPPRIPLNAFTNPRAKRSHMPRDHTYRVDLFKMVYLAY